MGLRFTVLASGSAGNASLVQLGEAGVLIDAGIGPRTLAGRLADAELSWRHVNAVLLTHVHTDHWRDTTLAYLQRQGIPLYCHPEHVTSLRGWGLPFAELQRRGLVRYYEVGVGLTLPGGVCCLPFAVRHGSGVTCGFRLEGGGDLFGPTAALGYATDLGTWDGQLADALRNVDILGLEFNHDVALEYASGRTQHLIRRVVGDDGHLSNIQAAALLREILRRSESGRLQHLVQLHLSRDCNRPQLAREAAAAALADHPQVTVHTAYQDRTGPSVSLGVAARTRQRLSRSRGKGNGRLTARADASSLLFDAESGQC